LNFDVPWMCRAADYLSSAFSMAGAPGSVPFVTWPVVSVGIHGQA
jgi:hypothetical protein